MAALAVVAVLVGTNLFDGDDDQDVNRLAVAAERISPSQANIRDSRPGPAIYLRTQPTVLPEGTTEVDVGMLSFAVAGIEFQSARVD